MKTSQTMLFKLETDIRIANLEDFGTSLLLEMCIGVLCVFGSRAFVPISLMCKKQAAVSQSSAKSEILSLDAGLRTEGTPALQLRVCVFCSGKPYVPKGKRPFSMSLHGSHVFSFD